MHLSAFFHTHSHTHVCFSIMLGTLHPLIFYTEITIFNLCILGFSLTFHIVCLLNCFPLITLTMSRSSTPKPGGARMGHGKGDTPSFGEDVSGTQHRDGHVPAMRT